MKKKKKQQFLDLIEKYKDDTKVPECPHFETCGGCMFQNMSYENQLLLKKEYLNTLFDGVISIDSVHPATPFRYRNRMDMVCAFGKVGLRERGSHKFVVDIEACPLMQEKSETSFLTLRPLIKEIDGYNYLRHKGYLRYIVLRQAHFTGETMLNFIIAERDNRLEKVIDAAVELGDSVSLLFNDSLADTSFGEITMEIKKGHIIENFDGIKFKITPNAFFQSNSDIALTMYRKIKENVKGNVLDLYSGVGSITLYVADHVEHITGVEVVQEAVDNAHANRELNNITNTDFVCADARNYLIENSNKHNTLILDPPRSGMHPKMLKAINEIKFETLIYMSCNPATFKNDFQELENYELQSFEAFDMFPQTPHVETLALFKRK